MTFSVNNSPLSGTEGTQNTFPAIKRRLEKEVESNISLTLKKSDEKEAVEVFGRGELQLGILIENMRREGFEFSVSPPQVVYKQENNQKMEPMEEVIIDVEDQYTGKVIERLSTIEL
jgi:GTP-binding protein